MGLVSCAMGTRAVFLCLLLLCQVGENVWSHAAPMGTYSFSRAAHADGCAGHPNLSVYGGTESNLPHSGVSSP